MRKTLFPLIAFAVLAPIGLAHAEGETSRTLARELALEAQALAHREAMRPAEKHMRQVAAPPGAALDVTPPKLVSVTAMEKSLAITSRDSMAHFRVRIADDQVGAHGVYIGLTGPHGQQVYSSYDANPTGSAKFSTILHWLPDAMTEPGEWRLSWVYMSDLNGNSINLDETALVAQGITAKINVTNRRKHDATAPRLITGRLLTTTVAVGEKHPGTNDTMSKVLAAQFNVTDAGKPAISGVNFANLKLCTSDKRACVTLYGSYAFAAPRLPSRRVIDLGTNDDFDTATLTPGDYMIAELSLFDRAGNSQVLRGREFGGNVDFSEYFPSTRLTVTAAGVAAGTAINDRTPPTLHSFTLSKQSVNLNNPLDELTFVADVQDDFSGLARVSVQLDPIEPSSNLGYADVFLRSAPRQARVALAWPNGAWNTSAWLPSGAWRIVTVSLTDKNGNIAQISESELQARGVNTVIQVENSLSDTVAPTLLSGRIETPTVSLSTLMPGYIQSVTRPPIATLRMTDQAADHGVSGTSFAWLTFCPSEAGVYTSFTLYSGNTASTGNLANVTVAVGGFLFGQYHWSVPAPGRYEVCQLLISDTANNTKTLRSPLIGGSDDMNRYFPSNTLTITP